MTKTNISCSRTPAQKAVSRKPARTLTEEQRLKMYKFQTVAGYAIVAISVVGAIVLCVTGQLPIPAGVGVALLAIFRFFALKREMKRQDAEQA